MNSSPTILEAQRPGEDMLFSSMSVSLRAHPVLSSGTER